MGTEKLEKWSQVVDLCLDDVVKEFADVLSGEIKKRYTKE